MVCQAAQRARLSLARRPSRAPKFTQHAKLRRSLTSTGDAELVEHTANDHYWADGGDGSGKNRLGVLLMELRAILRSEEDRSD